MEPATAPMPSSGQLWNRPGIPQRGWTWAGYHDLDPETFDCEMCGKVGVRYAHIMTHPGYAGSLDVGCDCCGMMTDDYESPRGYHREITRWQARRRTFVKSSIWKPAKKTAVYEVAWRRSRSDPSCLVRTYRARTVPGFFYRIEKRYSTKTYATEAEARGAAFDDICPRPNAPTTKVTP